jgi:phage protein D
MVDVSTITHPFPTDVAFNAPDFRLTVQGGQIPAGIRQLVERVEYESSDGMADLMRITFRDPRYLPPKGLSAKGPLSGLGAGGGGSGSHLSLRDIRVFQPGNEMSLWLGYGTNLRHVGRVIIRKVRPNFPRDDIPSVEVIGYTKDSAMMDNAPQPPKEKPPKGKRKKKGETGRAFKNTTFADAVRQRARNYDFELDVDDTPDARSPHSFFQKTGLTDYDFVKGLSNITGFYFWVDADEQGKWTLHFKDPTKLRKAALQDKVYTFRYDQKNLSSLLDFEPELAIQGATTKLQARVKDPATGKIFDATFSEDNEETPDPLAVVPDDIELDIEGNVLQGEYKTASSVKLFINDYSFQARTNRRFKSEAELIQWARQWYRRHRENFILSSGTIIGVENVMARQIHKLTGLGMGLDGEYFFSNVSHKLSNTTGYELHCTMRKVVPEIA